MEMAQYFEREDLPKYIHTINEIVKQPFFGRPPDSLRFAVYYHPIMFWIYGNAKERQEAMAIYDNMWCNYTKDMPHKEAAIAMGFIK
jgi:hypothetical protein